jgi:hypothetical protein
MGLDGSMKNSINKLIIIYKLYPMTDIIKGSRCRGSRVITAEGAEPQESDVASTALERKEW